VFARLRTKTLKSLGITRKPPDMLYLALGSNLGDRVDHLSSAIRELLRRGLINRPLRFSSVYETAALLPAGAPSHWDQAFLNMVVEAQSFLDPLQLLAEIKKLEMDLGRNKRERWAPREIDIDIIFWKDQELSRPELQIPHRDLYNRDFFLKPLSELLPHVKDFRKTSGALRCERISVSILPTQLMGIINVTPDSFSDGDLFLKAEAAVSQAKLLMEQGASILDLGAESTRPGALTLSAAEEWERLGPVLRLLIQQLPSWMRLSVDTRHAEVAAKALELGVHIINDVSAGEDPQMLEILKSSNCGYIFMHHLGVPVDPKRSLPLEADPVIAVKTWLEERLGFFVDRGISKERLIADPGIGFGKTPQQSWQLIQNMKSFDDSVVDILVGHSRKSFLNLITTKAFKDRDLETAVVSAKLAVDGLAYLRLHKVSSSASAIKTGFCL